MGWPGGPIIEDGTASGLASDSHAPLIEGDRILQPAPSLPTQLECWDSKLGAHRLQSEVLVKSGHSGTEASFVA